MLDIWERQDQALVEKLCQLQADLTGEHLIPNRVSAWKAYETPYNGYDLIRLVIKPHVVNIKSGQVTISSQSISYALFSTKHLHTQLKLIPLSNSLYSVEETTALLDHKITKDNILQYLTFVGHIYSPKPFYFFKRLNEINGLLTNVPPNDANRVVETILGIFPSLDGDKLSIPVERKLPFLLGTYFTLRMPCLFEGHLYLARISVSEMGMVNWDKEEKLNIQGIFDDEETYRYYQLESNPLLISISNKKFRKKKQAQRVVRSMLATEPLMLGLWPIFLFHMFLLFDFGMNDHIIYSYFEVLKQSKVISVASVILGAIGTSGLAFRFIFFEFINYASKFTPSVWSRMGDSLKRRNTLSKQTLVKISSFTTINLLVYSIQTVLALSLLIYGISNTPVNIFELKEVNFAESLMAVLQSIPLIGGIFEAMVVDTAYSIKEFPEQSRSMFSVLTSFMISTIMLGLIVRSTSFYTSTER